MLCRVGGSKGRRAIEQMVLWGGRVASYYLQMREVRSSYSHLGCMHITCGKMMRTICRKYLAS